MLNPAFVFAVPQNSAPRWSLKRTITPHQFLAVVSTLCITVIMLSSGLSLAGMHVEAMACLAGLLVIGMAAYGFARHARDGETILLRSDGQLQIDMVRGAKCSTVLLNPQRVRMSPLQSPDNLIWLHHGSKVLQIGRAVTPARRAAFAAELTPLLSRSAA